MTCLLFCVDSGFSSIRFSTVVIDEATQATEAAALVPIIRGCQQLILVGDQNQVLRAPAESHDISCPPLLHFLGSCRVWYEVQGFVSLVGVIVAAAAAASLLLPKKSIAEPHCPPPVSAGRQGIPPISSSNQILSCLLVPRSTVTYAHSPRLLNPAPALLCTRQFTMYSFVYWWAVLAAPADGDLPRGGGRGPWHEPFLQAHARRYQARPAQQVKPRHIFLGYRLHGGNLIYSGRHH